MRRPVAVVLTALSVLLLPAAPAVADGEPTMPLAQVQRGMECKVRSVFKGTDITTFDAKVEDVVAGDAAAKKPYLLLRLSGQAIQGTGVGPGFSGSPVSCPDPADGTMRIAGAISEGIGEYGGLLVLATPIELVLGEPIDPPTASVTRNAKVVRQARPLASPLTFGGLSPAVTRVVQRAARANGRVVYAVPGAPRTTDFTPPPIVPGAAMAASFAGGDLTAGSIGTVAYVDGDQVWGFGHPLDSVGRRGLLMQDAYVYAIVNNPLATSDLQTYKYAAPGHEVGAIGYDGINAITGRLGVLPDRFPLKVTATDEDRRRTQVANVTVVDEGPIGQPTGASALSTVAPIAVAQLAYNALGSSPVRQSGSMCVRVTLRERKAPLRFCNTYVGGAPGLTGVSGGPLVADVAAATGVLDSYRFGPIHITGVEVNLRLRRSLDQAFLLGAGGPRTVRRGRTATFTLRIKRVDGAAATRKVRVRVPRGTRRGEQALAFVGTSADLSASAGDPLEAVLDLGALAEEEEETDEAGPRTLRALAEDFAALARADGVTAAFVDPDASDEDEAPAGRQVLRDPRLRISGTAVVPVEVR